MVVRRGIGPLGTWMSWRKVALGIAVSAPLVLGVFLYMPFGLIVLIALFAASGVWRKIGDEPDHPNLGNQVYGTRSYKLEAFFTSLWQNRGRFLDLRLFGFGPPADDPDHEIISGWMPPTRLSSIWATLVALVGGFLDFLLAPLHYPFWLRDGEGFVPPAFMVAIAGAIAWYALIQVICAVRRWQGASGNQVTDAEPKPAVMLHLVKLDASIRSMVVKSVGIGVGVALFFLIVCLAVKAPFSITASIFGGVLLMSALFGISGFATKSYRSKWAHRVERKQFWQETVFPVAFKPDLVPDFIVEFGLPDIEEHQQAEESREIMFEKERERGLIPDDEAFTPRPYEPDVNVAMFAMPPGTTFQDYVGREDRMLNSLGVDMAAIVPVGRIQIDQEGNENEVDGTIGPDWFRVWYPAKQTSEDFLNPNITSWERELVVHSKIAPVLASLRDIGYCTIVSSTMLTRPQSPLQILELRVVPANNKVEIGNFIRNIHTIQDSLGIEWVRALHLSELPKDEQEARREQERRLNGEDVPETPQREALDTIESRTFVLLLGDMPVRGSLNGTQQVQLYGGSKHIANVWRTIDAMEWSQHLSVAGIKDSNGKPPKYLFRAPATRFVDKIVFDVPPGLSLDYIKGEKAVNGLKQVAGYDFMEVTSGGNMDLEGLSDEEKTLQESKYRPGFTMVAAKMDPLKRAFPFGEYKDQVLLPRERGIAKLDWSPGVYSDDTIALYKRGSDAPHLLVAGESGGGKSVLISSMLAQLAHNNYPQDLELWMIEPKTELQVWEDVDVVTRFVDSWTPNKQFMENSARLFYDAEMEMERRNEFMAQYRRQTGRQVRDIDQARKIALSESRQNGTPLEQHPLYFPFIYLIVEECASLFAEVAKEQREAQGQALRSAAELARKSRSAGIILTFITQYPTNASIPSVIRQQCARLGLKTRNGLASNVIIEQNGLETIKTKGVGMMRDGDEYRRFRSFWVRDGVREDGEQNDVLDLLDSVPKKGVNRVTVSGGATVEEQAVPSIPDSVFSLWDRQFGHKLDEAIASGRQTRDITSGDMGYSN